MTQLFKKISAAARNTSTYRIGLLQAKAYRMLKHRTQAALEPSGISAIEWAFLGLLADHSQGLRAASAAKELGVEAPFVSVLADKLEKKKFVVVETDPGDSRVKVLRLTNGGQKFVGKTEAMLRTVMKPTIKNVGVGDLLTYLAVLETIAKNCDESVKS